MSYLHILDSSGCSLNHQSSNCFQSSSAHCCCCYTVGWSHCYCWNCCLHSSWMSCCWTFCCRTSLAGSYYPSCCCSGMTSAGWIRCFGLHSGIFHMYCCHFDCCLRMSFADVACVYCFGIGFHICCAWNQTLNSTQNSCCFAACVEVSSSWSYSMVAQSNGELSYQISQTLWLVL